MLGVGGLRLAEPVLCTPVVGQTDAGAGVAKIFQIVLKRLASTIHMVVCSLLIYFHSSPMKKLLLYTFLLCSLAAGRGWAQTRAVSGVVTAQNGSGLPGVNVTELNSTNGTVTGTDGRYALQVNDGAILVFSFIGFESQQVAVGNRAVVDVTLAEDVQSLSEVVVVGYGTQQKKDLTGSIASVGGEDIRDLPITSFETALQGRATGVYINAGNGKLGQAPQIRVRGAASISAGNDPLYVIDGIIVNSADFGRSGNEPLNPLADINPNDIESVEILKDASAAAIYGSRASNGVVLITTKKGRAGRTTIDVGYFTGVSEPTRIRPFLNGSEYLELFTEAAVNEGYDPQEEFEGNGVPFSDQFSTNWAEEGFQRGTISQYNVAISGGTEKTRFYLSGQYSDQTGIIVGNEFDRINGRFNLDHNVNDRFRIGANLSLARSVNNRVPDDNAFSNPIQLNAIPPVQPKFDTLTGQLNRNTLYYNNLIELENASNVRTSYRTISNLYGSYELLPGFTFRTEFGVDLISAEEEQFRGRITEDGGPTGYGFVENAQVVNYTTNNTLTFRKLLADQHELEVLGGFSFQEGTTETASVEGRGFPNDNFKKIASAARITFGSSTGTGFSFLSYLARVNYQFADKYLFNVSGRLDGSSRFGQDRRYGFFPAASVGWIVSEEVTI